MDANYAGRGIGVCPEWAGSFDRFIEDVGRRPSADYSIDRIENDRGYEPGNVRWSLAVEQQRNKRNNRKLTAFGQTKCMSAWAEEIGVSPGTIFGRLSRGWSVEKAVSTRRLAGRVRVSRTDLFQSANLVGIMGMSL